MSCNFRRRRSWRQRFCTRAPCLFKVATELTGSKKAPFSRWSAEVSWGLVAHDVTACGCKLQTLVSVNEFKHRYQWTTYVNESEKRTNNFSSLQLQRHCAMTMVRWRVSCGSAQRQLPSMFQVTVHRKRPWRCAHSGFTVNHSFVIHSTQSILPRLLGVRCRVRSPA